MNELVTTQLQLVRYPNWQTRLVNYLDETRRPFEWGVFDCAMNAANSVLAITGYDLAKDFRDSYRDEESAFRVLNELGHKNMTSLAASKLPKTDSIFHAFSGDLAAFEHEGHEIVGLVYRNRIFSPTPFSLGMGSVNIRRAHTVFKVGVA